jgi:hypothetical protein
VDEARNITSLLRPEYQRPYQARTFLVSGRGQ